MASFTLRIETDKVPYQFTFSNSTNEQVARSWAVILFKRQQPMVGRCILSVDLLRDGHLWDSYDGVWSSVDAEMGYADWAAQQAMEARAWA